MANKPNIINILDKTRISYNVSPLGGNAFILYTDKVNRELAKDLINQGVKEFRAIVNRGNINIIIQY